MKKIIFSLMLATVFTCQEIELPNDMSELVYRCENNEVVCYIYQDVVIRGGAGGMSCKFKEVANEIPKQE